MAGQELGALSLRLQETGGKAVLDRIEAIDGAAKAATQSLQTTAAVLNQLGIGAKVSGGQVQVAASQMAQATSIANKFGQANAIVATGSTTAANATQQQATATQRATVATRQSVPAQQAQAQATARQTAATQALGGTLTKTDGQLTAFGKRGITALNGLAFAFSQMGTAGEVNLRAVAGQLNGVLSLMGRVGAVGSIISTVGLAVFDVFRANEKRAIERMALDRATAIKSALTQQKGFLDLQEANEKFAFEQGVDSLREFYRKRSDIISERTKAEVRARIDQAAALEGEAGQRERFIQIAGRDLPDALRGETLQQMDQLRAQARTLRAEAEAIGNQGQAQLTANTGERIAAEKQLQEQVRHFEASRLEAQGRTHEARLVQIETEAKAYDKALKQQGLADDERSAKVNAFTTAMRQQAALAQAQADIARYQTQLDTERARIQNELEAGKINELQAAQQVAAVENSALPTLREMVARALQFAAALGDQGAVAAIRQLKAELEGLGRDTSLDKYRKMATDPRAGRSTRSAVAEIERRVAMGVKVDTEFLLDADQLTRAAQDLDDQFAAAMPGIVGVLSDTLGAAFSGGMGNAKDVLLRGLGGIMQQMGKALISYGAAMSGLMPALLNPFTSGPAAIAAGAALVALGGMLGGIATGKGGSGSGAARSSGSVTGGRDTTRLFVASNTAQRTAGASTSMQAAPAMAPVTINATLLNPNDASSQRLLAQAVRAGERRGL